MFQRTNIQSKLAQERTKVLRGTSIMDQVQEVFEKDRLRENTILNTLQQLDQEQTNAFDLDLVVSDRIFHESQIKKICIDYRLRFLDSRFFKGDYPQAALDEIKFLENKHHITLEGFKIIAPSKMFVLYKTDDPLLFAPMGNDYFYLIHKWGDDLHPLRKWLMWPYKSFENILITVCMLSICFTLMIPDGLFSKEQSIEQDVMVFFFMFKSIAAVVLYYAFAQGKHFNSVIWNNKFNKSR